MEDSHQLHAPTALIPRRQPPVSIGKEAGWVSESVWTVSRRHNTFPCWIPNPDRQAASNYRVENRVMMRILGFERGEVTGRG
jgi:hypothetical protein